ncbi:hypothetical protein BC941DRAFT_413957 [Chlamydoabsidia padenii]|nr:hypothetical protein BC941DRAFT_413957 [Chlamydoabsidia padenii]
MSYLQFNDVDNTILPGSMATSTLMEYIGKDRQWTDDQIEGDVAILENNRLYHVRDLRALSNHSWSVMETLPLVRDLLRQAVDDNQQDKTDKTDKKKKKNKKKKNKEKKTKEVDNPTDLLSSPQVMKEVLSDDPETIRNTIRNGSIDLGKQDPLLIRRPSTEQEAKKSVSFSTQNGLIPNSTPTLLDTHDETTSSSEEDDIIRKQPSFDVRPIKQELVSNRSVYVGL